MSENKSLGFNSRLLQHALKKFELNNVSSPQLSICDDDTTIYSCHNGKSDRFNKVKLAADLKNDIQSVNWGKE